MMMWVLFMIIGYARISVLDQTEDTQIDQLEAYGCERVFSDYFPGKSGKEQQELTSVLSLIKEGDILVVTKLDRLARSAVDLARITEKLEQQKIDLIALNQNINTSISAAELVFKMIGAFAELERNSIRERCTVGMEKAKEKGVRFGRKPKLCETRVKELLDEYKQGGISRTELAKKYNVSRATLYRLVGLEQAILNSSSFNREHY